MSTVLSELDFVDLHSVDPTFIIELPYATTNNFTHTVIYDARTKAYLRRPVAEALGLAQQKFKEHQLGLKIWDAYRPFHIQQLLWQHCPDERYVMKPIEEKGQMVAGSAHNRGCAVDLTLVNKVTGLEINMPSAFDDFSRAAHRDYRE
ncbi:MAG: M15 family metallopeptidase, partial [Gammaproteobacteria bacterium]|nr:M15 family metallopeptidase [Gammaproteobacteria bacterium]